MSVDAQVRQLEAAGAQKVWRETASGARAIDRPEVRVFGLARLDDLDTVGEADDAARMHLDRIKVTDCEHPGRRHGKRGFDRVGRGAQSRQRSGGSSRGGARVGGRRQAAGRHYGGRDRHSSSDRQYLAVGRGDRLNHARKVCHLPRAQDHFSPGRRQSQRDGSTQPAARAGHDGNFARSKAPMPSLPRWDSLMWFLRDGTLVTTATAGPPRPRARPTSRHRPCIGTSWSPSC